MADMSIESLESDRKALVREAMSNACIELAPLEINVELKKATKIPLAEISVFGAAFASMSEAFRTVSQTMMLPNDGTLMRAFTADGTPLSISDLQAFKHAPGGGALGSTYKDGKFAQAHFFEAGSQMVSGSAVVPVDPMTIAMAIAVQQVTQKLDNIQATVDEMFDYIRQHDKADLLGNLETLADIMNGYRFNAANKMYMDHAHMKVLDIQQKARAQMKLYRSQTEKKLGEHPPVEVRGMIEARMNGVLDALKDYQLSTYIFSFATFLDPILCENFEQEKLLDAKRKIEESSLRYRKLYTRVYNELESRLKNSVDEAVLGGLSFAGKMLGKAVAATPIGEHTGIDEALKGAGEGAAQFNKDCSKNMLKKLHESKAPDVSPFKNNLAKLNLLCNEPTQLLTDGDNLYLIPEQGK